MQDVKDGKTRKSAAMRAVEETMRSGFRHHAYEFEQEVLRAILEEREIDIHALIRANLNLYLDVMGPTRIRSLKNSFISLITLLCRAAIDLGVDAEESFSLSDYYINEAETKNTQAEILALLEDMRLHYTALVREAKKRGPFLHAEESLKKHSPPVAKALRHISAYRRRKITVAETAEAAGLNPRYFAWLFKKECGVKPSEYIRRARMETALDTLLRGSRTAAETAELLGYRSAAHFSRDFRRVYGKTCREKLAEVLSGERGQGRRT
jgi:AraC-like DNA-binding protein